MINKYYSPWDKESTYEFLFSLESYYQLLNFLSIDKYQFSEYWLKQNPKYICHLLSNPLVTLDWIWSFYLPLLYDIKNYLELQTRPLIIGISGLPGSGKSTFGRNLEKLASQMKIPLKVISLDDFYLPSPQLDLAMEGNPWDVPRGLPGSHSMSEIFESIDKFMNTGIVSAPQFDKSLRNGLGDRCGWIEKKSKVLIIEGWFLGCRPVTHNLKNLIRIDKNLIPTLTKKEIDYRFYIQETLLGYLPVWDSLTRIWHLKAESVLVAESWKVEQEEALKQEYGSSLQGEKLTSFLRMIKTSIPQESLQGIKSDIVLSLNKNRQINSIKIK